MQFLLVDGIAVFIFDYITVFVLLQNIFISDIYGKEDISTFIIMIYILFAMQFAGVTDRTPDTFALPFAGTLIESLVARIAEFFDKTASVVIEIVAEHIVIAFIGPIIATKFIFFFEIHTIFVIIGCVDFPAHQFGVILILIIIYHAAAIFKESHNDIARLVEDACRLSDIGNFEGIEIELLIINGYKLDDIAFFVAHHNISVSVALEAEIGFEQDFGIGLNVDEYTLLRYLKAVEIVAQQVEFFVFGMRTFLLIILEIKILMRVLTADDEMLSYSGT